MNRLEEGGATGLPRLSLPVDGSQWGEEGGATGLPRLALPVDGSSVG
jgi:hypothetical protein